ncbi:MAG: hypothetical protein ACRDKU_07155 [Gaiellaceae bacterium]
MPSRREPSDFVFLPPEQAEPLLAAAFADGRLNPARGEPAVRFERVVRRLPPGYEAEEVVKVPRFLVEPSADGPGVESSTHLS